MKLSINKTSQFQKEIPASGDYSLQRMVSSFSLFLEKFPTCDFIYKTHARKLLIFAPTQILLDQSSEFARTLPQFKS